MTVTVWREAGETLIRCPHCDSRIELALIPATDTLGVHVGLGLGLTRTEGTLFDALHAQLGRWVGRGALLRDVWGLSSESHADSHMLREMVCRLRRDLSETGWWIETLRSTGYRLIPPPAMVNAA